MSNAAMQYFADLVGVNNILPIAQPHEGVESTLSAAQLGKVPSVYRQDGSICGVKEWSKNPRTTAADVQRWANDERYGFGILLGRPLASMPDHVAVCVDVDSEDEGYQINVESALRRALDIPHGVALPVRVRENSNRCSYILFVQMPEEAEPLVKRVLTLANKTDDDESEKHQVELLGFGQHFVAGGMHKSGAVVEWRSAPFFSYVEESVPMLPNANSFKLSLAQYIAFVDDLNNVLPVINDKSKKARKEGSAANCEIPVELDDFAKHLEKEGRILRVTDKGEVFFRSPYEHLYSEEQSDDDTSVVYYMSGANGRSERAVVSLHASDEGKHLADFERDTGFVVSMFDIVPADAQKTKPDTFANWNGMSAEEESYDRWTRQEWVKECNEGFEERENPFRLHLRDIPFDITVKENSKGERSISKLPTQANLGWILRKYDAVLVRNLMTWEIELLDRVTFMPKAATEEQGFSLLISWARKQGFSKETVTDHYHAIAERSSYHPVARLLHNRKWDGVERVKKVFACVPVAPGKESQRDALLGGVCAAAMAAIDNGYVSVKYAPTLYSEANDWWKSAFVKRMFDIIPGSFKEGVSVDPNSKDSKRNALFCWGAELGELDQMTKGESGPLKAFIPMESDSWRTEFKRTYDVKKRQTVFLGSVNKNDFIKDETMASRFPVIALAGQVKIDTVNRLLGWEWTETDGVRLADPEQLVQFWLEVRALRAADKLSHNLAPEVLTQAKADNNAFVARGDYHELILGRIDAFKERMAAKNVDLATCESNPFMHGQQHDFDDLDASITAKTSKWFSAVDVETSLGIDHGHNRRVGQVLTALSRDGVLHKGAAKGLVRYYVK